MTFAFDDRIVRASIKFKDGDYMFDGLAIHATGRKYMGSQFNELECIIYNMTPEQRNYILKTTSPLSMANQTIEMTLEVGRQSYGTFLLFSGNIFRSSITQPPDIGVHLIAYTNLAAQAVMQGKSQAALATTKQIAQSVADDLNLTLVYQAKSNKTVGNLSHNGSVAQQIQQLNNIGGIIAFIDNKKLIVVDANKELENSARLINSATGMIGIPQMTEKGVQVGLMIDNTIQLGGKITIESKLNPVANGDYRIQSILFDVANREEPFHYMLDCISTQFYTGTA